NQEKGTYLLAGEKNAKMIEGFDLGNSPLEFLDDKVKDKKIILTTTNGTKVFSKLKNAKTIFTLSLLNLTAVTKLIAESIEDWLILCAGREGIYDASDALCAGALLYKLKEFSKLDLSFNDASNTSLLLYERAKKNIAKELKQTEHGDFLVRQGFEKDIDFISQIDLYNNVPKFFAGKITL
ncbi:MAG: 2-phosphosulfolactate phosphatase, partial [Leptospiraceae bacterium]|nr:2-phosphosulfolactate phosphatase [Leptospiraceae bacterium]